MKKIGVLNTHLSRVIAAMGHTDRLVICDSGLPIPHGAEVVDLALTRNIPGFVETLRVVLSEAQIEQAIIASEMSTCNPGIYEQVRQMLGEVPVVSVCHEEFKRATKNGDTNVTFVRTGEATPYANIVLVSGVTFG